MRAPAQVRFQQLQKLLERLNDEVARDGLVVVEGPKDKQSLEALGIRGRILCLQSSRRSAMSFAEELDGEKNVVVLMDFDRQGVFLANRLHRILNSKRIHSNLVIWRQMRGLTRSELRSIEELPSLYERLEAQVNFHRSAVVDARKHH